MQYNSQIIVNYDKMQKYVHIYLDWFFSMGSVFFNISAP